LVTTSRLTFVFENYVTVPNLTRVYELKMLR